MTDDVVERLARYVANHPNADIMEVLANADAIPTEYRDVVEQLLSDNCSYIHDLEKSTYTDTTDNRCDPASSTGSRSDSSQIPVGSNGAPHAGTVPSALAELGKSFVPIDPGEPRVPRTEKYLHGPDDEIFQAYLEAGHNYGVVTRVDLAVVDEPERLVPLIDALPETAQQVSGWRTSKHVFCFVPGLDESENGPSPVQRIEGIGAHGATLYSESGLPHSGVCDALKSPTDAYRSTSRWVLAIRGPATRNEVSTGGDDSTDTEQRTVWAWDHLPDPGA